MSHKTILNYRAGSTAMKQFFSYTARGGFELHDTLEQARSVAEDEFEYFKNESTSDCEWPQEVEHICYGELRGAVVEAMRRPWDEEEDGPLPEDEYEVEVVEYELRPNTRVNASREAASR